MTMKFYEALPDDEQDEQLLKELGGDNPRKFEVYHTETISGGIVHEIERLWLSVYEKGEPPYYADSAIRFSFKKGLEARRVDFYCDEATAEQLIKMYMRGFFGFEPLLIDECIAWLSNRQEYCTRKNRTV